MKKRKKPKRQFVKMKGARPNKKLRRSCLLVEQMVDFIPIELVLGEKGNQKEENAGCCEDHKGGAD